MSKLMHSLLFVTESHGQVSHRNEMCRR